MLAGSDVMDAARGTYCRRSPLTKQYCMYMAQVHVHLALLRQTMQQKQAVGRTAEHIVRLPHPSDSHNRAWMGKQKDFNWQKRPTGLGFSGSYIIKS